MLHSLATCSNGALSRAIAALCAELEAAQWSTAADATQTYPYAQFIGSHIEIALPLEHCALIAVNYSASLILIKFAGPSADRPRFKPLRAKRVM